MSNEELDKKYSYLTSKIINIDEYIERLSKEKFICGEKIKTIQLHIDEKIKQRKILEEELHKL